MNTRIQRIGVLFGALASLSLAACVPLFVDGAFQTVQLSFRVEDNLPAGESRLIHTAVFPEDVKVRKTFVQVSGRLLFPGGGAVPLSATLNGRVEDENGTVSQRINMKVTVTSNGTFRTSTRLRKNIAAGDTLLVSITPGATAIAAGSQLALCIDMVRKRGELALLPPCVVVDDEEEDG